MKRFDIADYPLLRLLLRSQEHTLESITTYHEYAPEEALNALADHQSGAKVLSQKEWEHHHQVIEAWRKRGVTNTLRSDTVYCPGTTNLEWNELEDRTPGASDYFDKLMDAPSPAVYYLSGTIQDAIRKHGNDLIQKVGELRADIVEESGILLFDLTMEYKRSDSMYCAYHMDEDGFAGVFILDGLTKNALAYGDPFFIPLSEKFFAEGKPYVAGYTTLMSFALASVLFMRFFETETVTARSNSADKRHHAFRLAEQDYSTNIRYPVEIVDATWYRTIVNTNPFVVRGHFRRQRYGEGRGQVKFIYIKPFTKSGYTRRAKGEAHRS